MENTHQTILLPSGETITATPLSREEFEQFKKFKASRERLDKHGKILWMSQAKALSGLSFRFHNYGVEKEGGLTDE